MVAGHCLAPFDLWSFGLGGLPATILLGCWPLSCPFGTLQAQVSHLVRGVFQLPCSLKLNIFVVITASCTLNPGCQDLELFCRSFLFVLFWVLLSRFLYDLRSSGLLPELPFGAGFGLGSGLLS